MVYEFPPELAELYRNGFKNDLPMRNGVDVYELPIPATFLIARAGTIQLAFVDPDATKRLDPADIMHALRALMGEAR